MLLERCLPVVLPNPSTSPAASSSSGRITNSSKSVASRRNRSRRSSVGVTSVTRSAYDIKLRHVLSSKIEEKHGESRSKLPR